MVAEPGGQGNAGMATPAAMPVKMVRRERSTEPCETASDLDAGRLSLNLTMPLEQISTQSMQSVQASDRKTCC